jgi:hypothetical protein
MRSQHALGTQAGQFRLTYAKATEDLGVVLAELRRTHHRAPPVKSGLLNAFWSMRRNTGN